MVFVLHGLHKDFDNVRNQLLTHLNIPLVDELIERLLWIPSSGENIGTGFSLGLESSAFNSMFLL